MNNELIEELKSQKSRRGEAGLDADHQASASKGKSERDEKLEDELLMVFLKTLKR